MSRPDDSLHLSYLVPEGQYAFFGSLVQPLRDHGIKVTVNGGLGTADVVLAGLLPTDHRWTPHLERILHPDVVDPHRPRVVLWHWDLYSFTDYSEDRWARFLKLLPRADRVWSCTYETARELKAVMNVDSDVVPAWVDPAEFGDPVLGYGLNDEVLYAASGCGFGKRIDWMEKACKILRLRATVLRNQTLPRAEYVERIRRCRVYCMTAFEESNATIPAMEAGVCGRPVVLTDLPSSREVFGNNWGLYFQPNDFGDLVVKLGRAYHDNEEASRSARDWIVGRLRDGYGIDRVARLAARRLREVAREVG